MLCCIPFAFPCFEEYSLTFKHWALAPKQLNKVLHHLDGFNMFQPSQLKIIGLKWFLPHHHQTSLRNMACFQRAADVVPHPGRTVQVAVFCWRWENNGRTVLQRVVERTWDRWSKCIPGARISWPFLFKTKKNGNKGQVILRWWITQDHKQWSPAEEQCHHRVGESLVLYNCSCPRLVPIACSEIVCSHNGGRDCWP